MRSCSVSAIRLLSQIFGISPWSAGCLPPEHTEKSPVSGDSTGVAKVKKTLQNTADHVPAGHRQPVWGGELSLHQSFSQLRFAPISQWDYRSEMTVKLIPVSPMITSCASNSKNVHKKLHANKSVKNPFSYTSSYFLSNKCHNLQTSLSSEYVLERCQ